MHVAVPGHSFEASQLKGGPRGRDTAPLSSGGEGRGEGRYEMVGDSLCSALTR